MSDQGKGVFTAEALRAAMAEGMITLASEGAGPDAVQQVQPSSLDLTLGPKAWRVRASFLPGTRRTVAQCLDDNLTMHELDLTDEAVLEKGCVYVVELRETLALNTDVCAIANPKSSTGRIDVFVRLVIDYGISFEQVPAGYTGPLYVQISPKTFSIVVREGSTLNQLRLKRGSVVLSDETLGAIHAQTPLIAGTPHLNGGLGMSVQLAGDPDQIIGYRARRHAGLIDVDKPGLLDPAEFWEPIRAHKSASLILDPDEFYILATKEWVCIPPNLAAEMVAIDPLLGEFRVHYAGFFDPGFGHTQDGEGEGGSKGVLEVRGHDAPFVIEDGQLVARLAYEKLNGAPAKLYGTDLQSNYQGQGLKLSKHFKLWEA